MTRRGIVAGSVLAAWGAGLALLLTRELRPSLDRRIAEVALRVVPVTSWYAVERDGRQVGFASIEIDTVPRTLQVTEYLVVDGDAVGAAVPRVTDRTEVRYSRGLVLRDFEHVRGVGPDSTVTTGRVADSTTLIVTRPGAAGAERMPLSLPAFGGALGPAVAVLIDRPAAGREVALAGMDPERGATAPLSLRLVAESVFVVVDSAVADSSGRWFAVHRDTVRAWRIRSNGERPFVDAWVDAQGLVVESRRADGLRLRRTAFELAFENWRLASPDRAVSARADGRVVAASWLRAGAPRPAAAIDSLRIRLTGDLPAAASGWFGARPKNGTVRAFTAIPAARLRSRYSFPTTARWRQAFVHQLEAEPSLEVDHPAVARRAARLRGDEVDPLVVARRIVSWAHDSLAARTPAAPLTAAAAITAGGGDAREFALAVTALARAAGIPAQAVSGLLYHDGRFFTHAWSEVYVGRWVPVDGMLGQFPADAAHLALLRAAVDVGPEVARVLGRLPIEVVSVKLAPHSGATP